MHTLVTKADGTTEYFKVEKLRRSLRRAGATQDEISEIVAGIAEHLYDGIRTQEIYRTAFTMLRESKPPAATRYSLRRALFSLGPTDFRLRSQGVYLKRIATKLPLVQLLETANIKLISRYKDNHSFVVEAKFHA